MLNRKFISVATLLAGVLLGVGFSAVASERVFPKRGSVQFGATQRPKVNVSPEFAAFSTVFADIAESVIPTVVSITSTHIDTVLVRQNPFDFFGFPFFGGDPRQQQQQQPQARERRQSGAGSGVIVSSNGYILTNSHVVHGASEIRITLHDEREFDAEIVGVDTLADVAVIRITNDVNDLPVAYLGNSDELRPGDWVMAVGNPFGLSSTVTAGIVSALGRYTRSDQFQNFIQIDAAINPGNSGGALVNIRGELIGINTMILTRSGGYMGIGFAIPILQARNIMEQLIYTGEVRRGWLGVSIAGMDQTMLDALGLRERGVLINEVFENEPAYRAGIQAGDVVMSLAGRRTTGPNDLRNIAALLVAGETYPIEIIRGGRRQTLNITPTVRGESPQVAARNQRQRRNADEPQTVDFMGMTVRETDEGGAIMVSVVAPNSVSARANVRAGDNLLAIKTAPDRPFAQVKTLKELNREIGRIGAQPIVLQFSRGGQRFFVSLRPER
ncbi:MAG: Do family serine endopeptidase [Chitinivibrionia bacterium]|nr:Do family serine endopeptidase [Chitinivibrionia bacterium]